MLNFHCHLSFLILLKFYEKKTENSSANDRNIQVSIMYLESSHFYETTINYCRMTGIVLCGNWY